MTTLTTQDYGTYSEYLETWDGNYGDETTAEATVWIRGEKHSIAVHRLTQEEFAASVEILVAANNEFEEALAAGDQNGMENALAKSWFHEVALFL